MLCWSLLVTFASTFSIGGADEPRRTEQAFLAELRKLAEPLDEARLKTLSPDEIRGLSRRRGERALDLVQAFAVQHPGSPSLNEARAEALKVLGPVSDPGLAARGAALAEEIKRTAPKGLRWSAQAELYLLGRRVHGALHEARSAEEFKAQWRRQAPEIRRHAADCLAAYPSQRDAADAIHGLVLLAESAGDTETASFLRAAIARQFPDHAAARVVVRERSLGKEFDFRCTPLGFDRPLSLRDYRGKVVVINVWASWCIPCRAELGHLRDRYEKLHRDGLEVIGICLDENEENARRFIRESKLPWPQVIGEPARRLGDEWGIEQLPVQFVVDRRGRLRSIDATGKLDQLVPELLASRD